MSNFKSHSVQTITEYHRRLDLPRPEHPLISAINLADIERQPNPGSHTLIYDFYTISLKRNVNARMKYGQQAHDFDEGVLHFMSPGQVFTMEFDENVKYEPSGWVLLIHPDFLWNSALAKNIKKYEYFNYSVNEALYLSSKEEDMITAILKNIKQEYHNNIDHFSQNIIIAQIELLLNYAERFYQRQFITRKISTHDLLTRLEDLLTTYFKSENLTKMGLPTVAYISEVLNISPSYLNGMLKSLTGLTTQQHLHYKLIELAKEKLSTTSLTVSEIAYELGFEHLQSFSKLFKTKTNLSPMEFRHTFN